MALRARDESLRIVELDGNFGEAAALSAGFAPARGALVVTLDGDGQNDPADIPRLLGRLGPELDVVSGRRRERQEAFLSRVLPSRIANWLIARATGVPVHDTGCGLKVYRRAVVTGARLPRGMNRFLPAVLGVRPARVAEEWVSDRRRGSGRSHYGLSRTFAVLRDLPALPVLVWLARRRPAFGRALGGAPVAQVAVLLALILGSLGRPAGPAPPPPSRHHAMALAALRAGKHVWVEKPLALSTAQGGELVEAARQAARVLFVDETFLYDPLVREMKRIIDRGGLGEVCHLSFERLGMGRIKRDSNVWWNSAPHDLAILLYLG